MLIASSSFLNDMCLGFILFAAVLFWVAKKAASSSTVQRGALEALFAIFKK